MFPFAPLSTYLEPSFCDRIHPPRSQVARKLTPLFPHLAHVPSHPKSRPPLGFPDPNVHLIRTTLRTQPISSRTATKVRNIVQMNVQEMQRLCYTKKPKSSNGPTDKHSPQFINYSNPKYSPPPIKLGDWCCIHIQVLQVHCWGRSIDPFSAADKSVCLTVE
jgi:hypothetical protein